ncbi:MAG TPA: ABC transporter substrate-binding protein [Chloroflexota bacterium]|nr:ABC transporter substrate-binding protein [Chloroflexota bacterium]
MTSRRNLLRGALWLAGTTLLAACGGAAAPSEAPKPAATSAPAGAGAAPTTAPAASAAATKPAAGGGATTPAAGAATSAPAVAGAPAKPATGTEITYLNQSRGQFAAMTKLAENYLAQTGVKINIDSPGPVDYPKKLQAASQGGTMPDTYYALDAATMAPYYKAGFALNLKPEMDKGWKKNFQPLILDLLELKEGNALGIPPGIYDAPWEVTSYGFLYNPALLEKAKVDTNKMPTTTPQLMDMLKQLKAASVGAFATGGDGGLLGMIQNYASNWLTDEQIDATHAGKQPWTADGWKKTIQLYADMRDAGVIFNNALSADTPTLEKSFFNVNEFAVFFTGVYSIPVQVTTAPNFTAYSAFPITKAADAANDPRTPGGPGKNGVVNPKSKVVDAALAYIKWLTEKDQEQVFMDMVPLVPPNPEALDPNKIKPQLKPFAALMDKIQKVTTPRLASVNDALIKGVQSLLIKEKTVEQVLADVDKAQKG